MLPTRCTWALSSITVGFLAAASFVGVAGVAQVSRAESVASAPVATATAIVATAAPVDVTILQTVNLPWQAPEVIVTTADRIDNLQAVLSIDGVAQPASDLGVAAAGSTRSLTWKAAPGKHRCEVRVSGTQAGAPLSQVFSADVDIVAPLELQLTAADVDLGARKLRFHSKSDVSFAEVTLYDVDGNVLHQASVRFDAAAKTAGGAQAKTQPKTQAKPALDVSWPELGKVQVAKIAVRAFNNADTWADVEWTPLQIEVSQAPLYIDDALKPGAERNQFASAYNDVIEALHQHTGVPGLRLYVLGLSGGSGDNAQLAAQAQKLASYLQSRGIKLPILAGSSAEHDDNDSGKDRLQTILALEDPAPTQFVQINGKHKP